MKQVFSHVSQRIQTLGIIWSTPQIDPNEMEGQRIRTTDSDNNISPNDDCETMAKPLQTGLELTGEDALRFHRYMEGHEELPQRGREMMRVAVRLAEQE